MINKKEYMKDWYNRNKERVLVYAKRYRIENKDRIKEKKKEYYKKNSKKIDERNKSWMKNNPEKKNENSKKDYYKHRMKRLEKNKQRYENNREGRNKQITQWHKNNPNNHKEAKKRYYEKNKGRLEYRINNNISSAIWRSLKRDKDRKHWENLVGYTLKDLIKRLKSTMPKGYTWQDYLESRLHIDHKIPVTAFNFSRYEHTDFKRCWALSNLQLLPAGENIRKLNRITKPFQPALRI